MNRNSKRVCCLALGIMLLLQQPLAVEAAESHTYGQYKGGAVLASAKEAEYTILEISTEEELRRLAKDCVLDSWSADKKIVLQNDITLTGDEELSIPSFAGIFDGNGCRIANVSLTAKGSAVGLFRYVQESGKVRNLTVEGRITPAGSQSHVGGIAGVNYGSIENCVFRGSVEGDNEIGGIAGTNEATGQIRRCSSDAAVQGNHSTGGIVGSNHGILNNCSNSGEINIRSTEVVYELDDLTVENLEQINSTSNVTAHTDTGGVAGFSDGKIYYCSNSGVVGYQHVGYNTGGIVGRLHQGYLQNCTNTGSVWGRKDVGGIVGQMEPFLEIQYLSDKLKELDTETDRFLDMLDETQKELSGYSRQASVIARDVSANLKNANTAAGTLTDAATDLWYIYNQELQGVSNDLKRLGEELDNSQNGSGSGSSGNKPDITVSGGNLWDSVSGGNLWDSISGGDSTITIPDNTESIRAALRRFGESTSQRLDTVTGATSGDLGGIRASLDILNKSMEAACDGLGQLSDVLADGTDSMNAHMDALVEQGRVLRKLISEIRDDLFRYEGISVEDTSDEAASNGEIAPGDPSAEQQAGDTQQTDEKQAQDDEARYDTSSFQKGKITLCVNRGSVEADTNVGGIVGQIATEYDFDPEDDITLTGAESFDVEQTIKAVVRDSRNFGGITGKKDYVGGIVGRAEFGAVISCEAYGDVESTGGSSVGGIAGSAGYAIRGCYSMGRIAGKNNIGGIAGEGSDIFYSYSYNTLEVTGECAGAIAGKADDDGTLYGNYYVDGGFGGVDGIGYTGGAQPLSYEEFCKNGNVPEAFSRFTVTFLADGEELASYECAYGDSLSEEQLPEIPEKEGFYGEWPEFDYGCITGNMVLEAVYTEWVSSIASQEKDGSGRALVMASGNFYPDMQLALTQDGETYTVCVTDGAGNPVAGTVTLRVLCSEPEKTVVETQQNGSFAETESEVIGSYRQFQMECPGSFRVTAVQKEGVLKKALVIGGAAAALLAVILVTGAIRRRKAARRKAAETET